MKNKKFIFFIAGIFLSFSAFAKDYLLLVNGNSYEFSLSENQTALDFVNTYKGKEINASKFGGFEYYVYTNLELDKNVPQTSDYEMGKIYFNIDYKAVSFAYKNHNIGKAKAILIGEIKDKSVLPILENGSNKLTFKITE